MPEFIMLFLIFFLLAYCILGTFSSVLSEEQLFCWDHDLAVVRRITSNKHLDGAKIDYPPEV